jgi:hypothetical protein
MSDDDDSDGFTPELDDSIGKTGFGVAVGILSVFILTAIILGSVSLIEVKSNTSKINSRNVTIAGGDPTETGVVVSSVDNEYQVSLDYSQGVTNSFISLLEGVTPPGIAKVSRVLTLDANMGVSGISTLRSKSLYGQLGDSSGVGTCPAYIRGLSVTNGSYHKGILISGDTTTNIITGDSTNSAIIAGDSNAISDQSYRSFIGGGVSNNIKNISFRSFIGGGAINNIGTNSPDSAIIAGYDNGVSGQSYRSFIGGGESNKILRRSNYSGIIYG